MSYPIDTTPESPNQSSRNGARIGLIVLHATVGNYESSLDWLCNPQIDHPELRVSTHYLIRKDGYINQLVPDSQAAWHAGKSTWMGMNSQQIQERSLGIELENANDGRDPYPPQQLAAAHWLCQMLIARYNIERADVVRHLDIAVPKGRKTDPAGLPWPAFADSLYMDSPPTPQARSRRYKVKANVTTMVRIRSAPRTNAAVLGRLNAGDVWVGMPVVGQTVSLPGFGSGSIWVRSTDARFVWAGLLEEVT